MTERMDVVMVMGGAGFIGSNWSHFVLANTSKQVVVVDKLTYAGNLRNLAELFRHPRFNFVKADIVNAAAITSVLEDYHPLTIVNFAAETHVDRSIDSPRAFIDTNIVGVYTLLEAVRAYSARLESSDRRRFRLLHVSTDEVYGSLGATGTFCENSPYAPNSPYAASKAAADHLVYAYHRTYGLPGIITNCSNNYGPYQYPEKLIPLVLLNALAGQPIPIYGDGLNVRDWLYVEDHCRALQRILEQGKPGERYNIGGQQERTNIQVVDAICEALGTLRPAAENPALAARGLARYHQLKTFVPDRPGHDRRYAIDASKLITELGWEPKYDFDQGIKSTVQWYLEHHDWCEAVQADGGYSRQRLGLATEAVAA